jgi:pyruvate/2-oxoglutarate dehydrogenase complex dihydrolipoamide acyltransferase (E2) component
MSTGINMPKFGATMEQGEIVKWIKGEGEQVEKGEAIAEVMTDKITNVIEAPVNGVIDKILYNEGETVGIGKVIGTIK